MELDYTIRRSTRARRVRVAVDAHDGVQVTLPARAREREAALAVAELRPWIERRLAEVRAARERLAVPAGHLPYLGDHLVLAPEAGRLRAHRRGDALLVPADEPRPAIERWYRRTARAEIAPRLDEAVAALGARYTKLTIREQRTRWGSCSTTGAMSFNWRLLLGARGRPRLRGLARGVPPRRHGPLAPLLVAARAPPPGLPRAAALAARQRHRARAARLSDGPPLRARARRGRCARGRLRRGGEGRHAAPATTAGPQRRAAAPAGARAIAVVGRQRLGARLEEWTLQTPALRDPTRVRVLLPAGYGSDAAPPLPRALPAARRGLGLPVVDAVRRRAGDHRPRPDDRRHARRRDRWLVHGLVRRRPARAAAVGDLPRRRARPVDRRDLPDARRAPRPRGRRAVDGRLRRAELRRAPPGHVRRGGVVLRRARGRVGRRVGRAQRQRGALARAPADLDRRAAAVARARRAAHRGRTARPARSDAARRPGAGRARSSATCTAATCACTRGCARSASATCGTTTGPARTPGPTGAATCARRCPISCASSRAPDRVSAGARSGSARPRACRRATPRSVPWSNRTRA